MKTILSSTTVSTFLTAALCWAGTGQAASKDVPGTRDHAMAPRYPGSIAIRYEAKDFDEATLPTGKVKRDPDTHAYVAESHLKLEGRVTRVIYELRSERSSLEVMRNYEIAFGKAGFEVLWSGSEEELGRNFPYFVARSTPAIMIGARRQRHLVAKLARDTGEVHVSLYVCENRDGKGPLVAQCLEVVESKPMDQGLVALDAEALAKKVDEKGSVPVYGIYFDYDQAIIKPESAKAIAELAAFLGNRSTLHAYLVGHTDDRGRDAYNLTLSQKRAGAVVNWLIAKHGIDPQRLSPRGVGPYCPVASNQVAEGRALNRRVELVVREQAGGLSRKP